MGLCESPGGPKPPPIGIYHLHNIQTQCATTDTASATLTVAADAKKLSHNAGWAAITSRVAKYGRDAALASFSDMHYRWS